MGLYKWEEILKNCIKDNTIKSIHLQHIPKLKDSDNWQAAEFLGRVQYDFKYTSVDGGLVRLRGKLFYVNIKQIQVLQKLYKWDIKKQIKVIE